MNSQKFSEAMGELDSRYVDEAISYKKTARKPVRIKLGVLAACLAIVAAIGGIPAPFSSGMIVSAYAYGTDEEITTAGAVINSGTISDSGEMKGHPLMFYLSGKDIVTVRFSCKNQQISFLDWTEKRNEYGNAQNFTVAYGEDESEYYYLTINWVPNAAIRELTDNEDSKIAALPEEMRNDIIVMEISFENGKKATKAITISLLDNGTFFASFDNYQISEEDTFINRPDSEAVPRDILNSQDNSPSWNEEHPFGDAPIIEDDYKDAGPNEAEQTAIPNSITFTGTIIDNVTESLVPMILVDVEENSVISYDKVLFELTEEQKEWEFKIGMRVQIVCPDVFQESLPPIGNLISITEIPNDEVKIADEKARAYYENTVFEIVSLKLKSQTENEIIFSVCVSRGGVIQEPDRTITLQLNHGTWEVVNEGY